MRLALAAALIASSCAPARSDEPRQEPPPPAPRDAAPAAAPAPAPRDTTGMVRVPGGTLHMGSLKRPAEPNEGPPHDVVISPFFIDRAEVTVEAYRACVDAGVCRPPRVTSKLCTWLHNDPRLPMSCVSFDDAELFCASRGQRLPSEAEWEWAARGPSDRPWPWGHEPPSCDRAVTIKGDATAESCSPEGPRPVGSARGGASYFGLVDMGGNVEEWVSTIYDDRYLTPAPSSSGPFAASARVLRGGSFLLPRAAARTTARSWASLEERGPGVGFRCAVSASVVGQMP